MDKSWLDDDAMCFLLCPTMKECPTQHAKNPLGTCFKAQFQGGDNFLAIACSNDSTKTKIRTMTQLVYY